MIGRFRQQLTQFLLTLSRNRARRKGLTQQTMHDKIRITADWRGEMRVVTGSHAEMAQAHIRITRLLHRAQSYGADNAFLRTPLYLFQYLLHIHRLDLPRLVLTDEQAESPQQVVQTLNLLRRRLLMYTVHERKMLRIHVTGYRLIGCQHAFLDNGLSQRTLTLDERDRMSLFVQLDLDLWQVEVDRATTMTFGLEYIPQPRKRRQHIMDIMIVRQERFFLAYQHLVDDIIRQTAIDMDNRRQDLIARELALW